MFDANERADLYIATRCLQYLTIEQKAIRDLDHRVDDSRPNASHLAGLHKQYPLLEYAATRWAHHARRKNSQLLLNPQFKETLPLTGTPNLWKAWIMLQPADIWENQLALCRVVVEASIRGSACPIWNAGFWKERILHRISTQTHENTPQVSSERAAENSRLHTGNDLSHFSEKTTLQKKARELYLARALCDRIVPGGLSFSRGDIMTVYETGSKSEWWAKTRVCTGFVDGAAIEVSSRPIPYAMGIPFYHLAIALLEIAHQSPLYETGVEPIEKICFETDFAAHFRALDKYVLQAGSIMGKSFEVIVQECLKNVVYTSAYMMIDYYRDMQGLTVDSDLHLINIPEAAWTLFMKQDQAVKDIYAPLQAMVKSGFRASRQLFVPHRLQQQLRISRQLALGPPAGLDAKLSEGESSSASSSEIAAST